MSANEHSSATASARRDDDDREAQLTPFSRPLVSLDSRGAPVNGTPTYLVSQDRCRSLPSTTTRVPRWMLSLVTQGGRRSDGKISKQPGMRAVANWFTGQTKGQPGLDLATQSDGRGGLDGLAMTADQRSWQICRRSAA